MYEKEEDIEQMLLGEASLDELIKMKIEKEFRTELESANKKPQFQTLTEIAKVPRNLIFSKSAVYKLFNRNTKAETYINGLQAEAMLGIQHSVREKISNGQLGAFTTDDAFVKFEKVNVEI